jgi:4-amino-4-deoxy-L-arabinose transferase-like glycosyltransferase
MSSQVYTRNMLTEVQPGAGGGTARPSDGVITGAGRLVSPAAVVAAVAALALALRAVLLTVYPFDGLYGQDAYFYLSATRDLVAIWTDPAKLRDWLTISGTPPVSVWPLGYHLQMALAALITGLGPASGQLVSLLAGVLTPVWTALLAWHLLGPQNASSDSHAGRVTIMLGALFAGAIVALAAIAVRGSIVVMSDMPAVHWATAGVLGSVVYLRRRRPGVWLGLLAGLCLGIAALTRYIYPLLLVPVALYAILGAGKGRRQEVRVAELARRLAPLLIPVIVLYAMQLLHNAIHPVPTLPSPVIATWSPLNAFGSNFAGPDGRQSFAQPMFVFYLVRPFLSTSALGPAVAFFVLSGAAALFVRRLFTQGGLLLGWFLTFAGFYSGSIYQADRFVLSYLPPLAVLAGLGLAWLLSFVARGQQAGSRARLHRLAVGAALSVLVFALSGLVIQAGAARASVRELYTTKQDYLAGARCLVDRAGDELRTVPVFSFAVTFTLKEYTFLRPRELYFETPAGVDAALATAGNPVRGYLILPVQGFEEQWQETPMGATYRRLMARYHLVEVACPSTSFTLFEIR